MYQPTKEELEDMGFICKYECIFQIPIKWKLWVYEITHSYTKKWWCIYNPIDYDGNHPIDIYPTCQQDIETLIRLFTNK